MVMVPISPLSENCMIWNLPKRDEFELRVVFALPNACPNRVGNRVVNRMGRRMAIERSITWEEGRQSSGQSHGRPSHMGGPLTEAPLTEAPLTEAPLTEAPLTEAPLTEAPLGLILCSRGDATSGVESAGSQVLKTQQVRTSSTGLLSCITLAISAVVVEAEALPER